jgi:hypothetical protein
VESSNILLLFGLSVLSVAIWRARIDARANATASHFVGDIALLSGVLAAAHLFVPVPGAMIMIAADAVLGIPSDVVAPSSSGPLVVEMWIGLLWPLTWAPVAWILLRLRPQASRLMLAVAALLIAAMVLFLAMCVLRSVRLAAASRAHMVSNVRCSSRISTAA